MSHKFRILALLLLACTAPRAGWATSVLAVDVEQLVAGAKVIFEGEVLASEARWNSEQTYIHTHVTFRVVDLLKGSLPGDTVTVRFAGGTVDGTTLKVGEMDYPETGERGIYFLEDPSRDQVNPLLGWSQGRYRIERDQAGTERVMSADRAPVMGFEEGAATPVAGSRTALGIPLSGGVARGLQLGQPQQHGQALDKAAFKRALRDRVDAQRRPSPGRGNAGEDAS